MQLWYSHRLLISSQYLPDLSGHLLIRGLYIRVIKQANSRDSTPRTDFQLNRPPFIDRKKFCVDCLRTMIGIKKKF